MNIIVATAIALRMTLPEDYIYDMHVTTIITPDINWSICQYCPSMDTTVSSDPNLIPSVSQFHLWLHEHFYCCMYIMAPAQKIYILSPLNETLLHPRKCNHCFELKGATIA